MENFDDIVWVIILMVVLNVLFFGLLFACGVSVISFISTPSASRGVYYFLNLLIGFVTYLVKKEES